jgi:hypothetical protein
MTGKTNMERGKKAKNNTAENLIKHSPKKLRRDKIGIDRILPDGLTKASVKRTQVRVTPARSLPI